MNRKSAQNGKGEVLVFLGLAVLLAVVFADVGGEEPVVSENGEGTSNGGAQLPLEAARMLLNMESYGALIVPTNSSNPFYTEHFLPKVKPTPEPAKTRTVSIVYQGHYKTQDGRRKAYFSVDGELKKVTLTEMIVGDLTLAVIERKRAAAMSSSGEFHDLEFKAAVKIEIPNE